MAYRSSYNLSEKMYKKVHEYAKKYEISISDVIRMALAKFFKEEDI